MTNTKLSISRNVLVSILIRKHYKSQITRPVHSMADAFVAPVQSSVHLGPDELPALAMVESEHHWLLITTERTWYCNEGKTIQFQHSDVLRCDYDIRSFFETINASITRLDIYTTAGIVPLDVEPDATHSRLMGIYDFIAAKSEKLRSASGG
jgi:hypothetical protein